MNVHSCYLFGSFLLIDINFSNIEVNAPTQQRPLEKDAHAILGIKGAQKHIKDFRDYFTTI